jgi:hypothetical protein
LAFNFDYNLVLTKGCTLLPNKGNMKDLFISLSEIEKDLKQIEDLGINLTQRLTLLSQSVKYIFSQIKTCATIEAAHDYFIILDKIQSSLVSLACEEDINVPERLSRFVSDFDNFKEAKEYYFPKIKSGEYTF